MNAPGASLYTGVVRHRRLRPVGHKFAYRVFSLLLDIDRIDETAAQVRLFSRNRFNFYSFHDCDHGPEGAAPLGVRIRALLASGGFAGDGRIELLCYPRILGYVFNPLSVYFCRNKAGRLEAMIYEVRNTFGGMHSYVIAAEETPEGVRHCADKEMHVSPFMEMDQRYLFNVQTPGDRISVIINQSDAEGPIFQASFAGDRRVATDQTLRAAIFEYPLMTLKVIAAIHFEAFRLVAKGLRLRAAARRPAAPATIIRRDANRKAA